MDTPPRLTPLLEQFEWGCLRLLNRMTGPEVDSGNGAPVPASLMTCNRAARPRGLRR